MTTSALATALLRSNEPGARLLYGVATGANTVAVMGADTAVTLPAVVPVATDDYCLILEQGADRIIIGPIGGTIGGGVEIERGAANSWVGGWTNLSSAEGDYTFIGGPDTSDYGILHYRGSATCTGTPTMATPRVVLPSGFQFDGTHQTAEIMHSNVVYLDGGTGATGRHYGHLHYNSTTSASFWRNGVLGANTIDYILSATTPFTWANTDVVRWTLTAPVVRV